MARVSLPIDAWVPGIVELVRTKRAAVVTAEPGAGKTTRVPPALAADGPVLVLQPRRVAARSIAHRIAGEQDWTLGREVGWQVRFERRFGPDTRVLLATEGILTARAQSDPLLSDFVTIVLDEFHERSIHADLGIALARQAWLARDDLRIVVMSATLDAAAVSNYLDGCPIVSVPGAVHPVDVRYDPAASVTDAVRSAVQETDGSVLCFLPGAAEIRRAARELPGLADGGVDVVPLFGAMDAAEQDRALATSPGRRVILATNIAETSLTVPGVRAVVDTGLQKVARYDPDRAIDSLETERVSLDAADQRAGRAGRLGPGLAVRLWDAAIRLRAHREPDVRRIDLCGPVLEILAWGGDATTFDWFERPPDDSIAAAVELLERLGAIEGIRLTEIGRRMAALPLHPRLARIAIAARGARSAAVACAILSEPGGLRRRDSAPAAASDLLDAVEQEYTLPRHVIAVADAITRLVRPDRGVTLDEADLGRAILAGYPDRVAKRREPGSTRFLLASGHGAVLGTESGVRDADFLVALDVVAGRRGDSSEARIRMASGIERSWLQPTSIDVRHQLDDDGVVRAFEVERYGAIVLRERPAPVDGAIASALMTEAFLARPLPESGEQVVRRLRFAGMSVDLPALAARAASAVRSWRAIDLEQALTWEERERLRRDAPTEIMVPSGRTARLNYLEDGGVSAGVKLQELFGLADTPRLGPRKEPVLLELRAPNGRPVQMTRDLRSFWERTYPEVRRELRGRYPKHPWPDDPWTATPTARTTRRVG